MLAQSLDFVIGLAAGLLVLVGLPLAVFFTGGRFRRFPVRVLVILIIAASGAFALVGSILVGLFGPSLWVAGLAIGFSFATCVALMGHTVIDHGREHSVAHWQPNDLSIYVPLLLALAMLSFADSIYLFALQNWDGFDRALMVQGPFQLDPVRNTNLISAIIRGEESLFIPKGTLGYQIVWHRSMALLLMWPTYSSTGWYQVQGATVATGVYLLFTLYLVIFSVAPSLRKAFLGVTALTVFVGMDGNVVELIRSAPESHNYEYFSPKILTLTAPHHSFALANMAVFLAFPLLLSHRDNAQWLRVGIGIVATVTSPPLAAIYLPFYYVIRFFFETSREAKIKTVLEAAVIAGVAFALFPIASGSSLLKHLAREGAVHFSTGISRQFHPLELATFWTNSAGVIALAGAVALVYNTSVVIRDESREANQPHRVTFVILAACAATLLFWNYAVTDVEARRHAAMVVTLQAAFASSLTVAAAMRTIVVRITAALMPLVIASHVVFLRIWLSQPSLLAQDIRWTDYFCANRELARLRGTAVVAAAGQGVVLPISNEAATTLVPREATVVHQQTTESIRRILRIQRGENHGPYRGEEMTPAFVASLRTLGFNTVVWGPVEALVWGPNAERALLQDMMPATVCGLVTVHREPKAGMHLNVTNAEASAARESLNNEMQSLGRLRARKIHAYWKGGRVYAEIYPHNMVSAADLVGLEKKLATPHER